MDNKKKNILIWVLTWAGLLLIVLYSPLGSPELFNQNNYYTLNQSISYNNNGESTVNFPAARRNSNNGGSYQAINIPEYNSSQSKMYSYSVSGSGNSLSSNTSYTTITNSFSSNQTTSNSGGGGGGESFYSSAGNNSRNKNTVPQQTGLLSLSTDLSSLTNNSSNKQLAGTATNGSSDPGGDPTGDPIPIGDGEIILLFLAIGYVGWKIRTVI